MRDILFKAKRLDNGEWVEGSLLQTTAVSLKSFIVTSCCYTFEMWDWKEVVQVDTDTICQYTGLTDKNGCKIWENDVVKMSYRDNYFEVGPIKYSGCSARYCFIAYEYPYSFDESNDMEVIGNIFDNPELLEV